MLQLSRVPPLSPIVAPTFPLWRHYRSLSLLDQCFPSVEFECSPREDKFSHIMSGSLSKSYSARYCVSSSDSEDDPGEIAHAQGDVDKVETTKLGKEVDATNLPECTFLGRSIRSATIFPVVDQFNL